MTGPSLTPAQYDFICQLVRGRTGLDLGSDKQYLIQSRLHPLAERFRFADVGALVEALRASREPELVHAVAEALATHESLFFRDQHPFDYLRDIVIPEFLGRRKADEALRIWSAACSHGQEPYSILMVMLEASRSRPDLRFEIVATDFSRAALERATLAHYSGFEVQRGLGPERLETYFDRTALGWQLKARLREQVRFIPQNFLDPFEHLGQFHVVFCRNVLIYFNHETKRSVVERIADRIHPGGALALGSAETLMGLTSRFGADPRGKGAIYRKTA